LGPVDYADSLGLNAPSKCQAIAGQSDHAVEGRSRFTKHRNVGAVHPESAEMAIGPAIGIEDAQGAVRIGERESAEEDGVYEAENGDVGTEAESQRQDGHRGKHRRTAEESDCVAQVLPDARHSIT